MPITFTVYRDQGYFLAEYEGTISYRVARDAWGEFMAKDPSVLALNQLIDVSRADFTELNTGGVESFTRFMEDEYQRLGVVAEFKSAVYAPDDLPFGMSRMYGSMAVKTPERVQVFRERSEAKTWLDIPQ